MTSQKKQELFRTAHDQLKLAKNFADCMAADSLTPEKASSLCDLTLKANAAVVNLRSAMAGNDQPKVGG